MYYLVGRAPGTYAQAYYAPAPGKYPHEPLVTGVYGANLNAGLFPNWDTYSPAKMIEHTWGENTTSFD